MLFYNHTMTTQTMIQNLIKSGDFVIVPREFYENILAQEMQKEGTVVKRSASFHVPKKHKAFYDQLDKDLSQALMEIKQGKFVGPFDTVKESQALFESLGLNHK